MAPRVSPTLLLVAGAALIFMTFMRYSLPVFGWIVFAPFLAFLHERATSRHHLVVLATLVVGFVAAISKMATEEIPWAPPVPMFAVPIAFAYFLAISVGSAAHRRLDTRWGIYTFASMATALGWIQYTFTPGSSWGILAHTQRDHLPLVQIAALTGVGGITFLVALGSGLAAAVWTRGVRAVRMDLALFMLMVGSAFLYGELRLGSRAPGAFVRVGGVVSPVTHKEFHAALADVDTLRKWDDELFARSTKAADLGARVVVWNEMATVVTVAGEDALTSRGQAFARERGVMLLMAYGVAKSMHPFHDANKYRIYLPDGTLADEYIKRHPVPGDPDDVGTAHARVVSFGGLNYGGAICYDYGFPAIARDNALDGAGIALVPSSDWGGIDPEHGQMAIMNAVAVGLPMVRPVRAATSFATDQFGRVLASLPASDSNDGVMIASIPSVRVRTLYTTTGEVVPLVALAFCVLTIVRVLRQRSRVTEIAVQRT